MFLNVTFQNKINNPFQEIYCCQQTCCKSVVENQFYIQRISDISINNGVYCLDCGLKEMQSYKEIVTKYTKSLDNNIQYCIEDIRYDILSLKNHDNIPKIGDMRYIYTTDDINGGLARIITVEVGISGGEKNPFVRFDIFPRASFNWKFLKERQEDLQKSYGNELATVDIGR